MKTQFWLLDLNYESVKGNPAIHLWGITPDHKRVLVVDKHEPHFFLESGDLDADTVKQQLGPGLKHPVEIIPEMAETLDREHTVLKLVTKNPESLANVAKQAKKSLPGARIYEHDLRPATQYQNDRQIRPCQWYEVDADPEGTDPDVYSADHVLAAAGSPEPLESTDVPDLRVFAFHQLVVSEFGSPSPARDPIRAISWTSNDRHTGLLETTGDSDKDIIEQFTQAVTRFNPDIVFSFGGNKTEWPYIVRRARETGIALSVGRGKVSPHQSLYGHFSITGRANIDLADFAEDLYDLQDKTLENIAKYLGLQSRTSSIDETEYFMRWSSPAARSNLRNNIQAESETILETGIDVLPYLQQLSWLCSLPLDQVLAAAVGFRVDSYMMMEAKKLGQLIPPRTEQPIIPYRGAIVLKPEPGLYENVAVLDYSSMYPSLMIKYNLSPETLVKDRDDRDTFTVPEFGHKFLTKPPGLYPTVLKKLIDNRQSAKQELARLQKGIIAYRLMKARERAAKILTNATYGYAGWAGSRWYAREVGESAAALGRKTITESVSIAKSLGLKVLYGDTDSIFLEHNEARVQEYLRTIERKLGLDINVSQVYKVVLFTEARKKYAGLKPNGEVDIVGMEAIRGDWSGLAKEVQNTILRMVLEDKSSKRALSYVVSLSKALKTSNLPLSSFIIWKTLTKRPEEYDVHAPHVEAAKKLAKSGWPIGSRDRVGYVIEKGTGKLYERAQPYFKTSPDNIDYDYYLENQVLPVAVRVLGVFGVTENQVLRSLS